MPDPLDPLFDRLSRSAFRRRFRLGRQDRDYLEDRGLESVLAHAAAFIATRLAPALTADEQAYVVRVIGRWLQGQEQGPEGGAPPRQGRLF
ncbi:DUF4186 family protein [Pigmentiphaga sp. H8]|uniref:DUF4186 family protein n=1 Tax=Pigmentiphaga sp. H8 TaxID=2488560 RepID=UPI000F5AFB2D|nr:DUF4186 family protein [Pigmentiphaga sp. H8]AZG10700.1 DUF4186 family protein [Pigmentiphaga sp. H8]